MKMRVVYTITRTRTLDVTPAEYRRFQADPEALKPLINAPKTRSCIHSIHLKSVADFAELIRASHL